VIGVIVACPLAAAIAGYNRLSSSGDWHAQARIVSARGALPDFSGLVAAYRSAVVNIAATQMIICPSQCLPKPVVYMYAHLDECIYI
jgi:hypothetical protein